MSLCPADIVMYSKLQCLLEEWLLSEQFPEGHFGDVLQKRNSVNAVAIHLTRVVQTAFTGMEEIYLQENCK